MHFLGHIISGQWVRPSPENVAKVLHFAVPEIMTQARALVGMEITIAAIKRIIRA